jgi:curli production assembly/transport component CsgE
MAHGMLPCAALAEWADETSQSKPRELDRPIQQDAYGGIVVNQTMTLAGHDFYKAFVAAWRDRPLSERYAVTVGERPSVRLGSQVWVEYGRRRVFQSFLPPARARAGGIGEKAAETAYENVVQSEAQRLLFRDPDIGPDEL